MQQVRIEQTRDTGLVFDLLSRWKPRSAHAFVRSPGRMRYLIADGDDGALGVLVGTHDFCNWSLLDQYQHLGDDDHGSYVQAMWVDPDRRSLGTGGALLEAFVGQARDAGSLLVVAIPDEDDGGIEARLDFFERHGFAFLAYPGGVREPWIMGRPLE